MIVKEQRKNASEEEIRNGCPTFDEFVKYVSKPIKASYNEVTNFTASVRAPQCKTGTVINTINHWLINFFTFFYEFLIFLFSFHSIQGVQFQNCVTFVEFTMIIF